MKEIDLICKNCGANMELNEDRTKAKCPYCRNEIIFEKKETIEEQAKRIKKLEYARQEGKRKSELKAKIGNHFAKVLKKLFTIAIIIAIISACFTIYYKTVEKIEDPFEYIEVTFSGISGIGRANIEIKENKDIDYNEITYKLSKSENLRNGETISIQAESSKYFLKKRTKKISVNNLLEVVKGLDELNNNIIEEIHKQSSAYQTQEIKNTIKYASFSNLAPYKMYLLTDGKNKNILFDMYTVEIKTSKGTKFKKYVVTSYENLIIVDKEKSTISYNRKNHFGNLIFAGNPKINNAFMDEYAGNLWGFESIDDFKTRITENFDVDLKLYEK